MDKTSINPTDYVTRARRCADAVARYKALHLRLVRSMPSLKPEERRASYEPYDPARPRYCTKGEKLDRQLEELYAAYHREGESALGRREIPVAQALRELFALMDRLSARL